MSSFYSPVLLIPLFQATLASLTVSLMKIVLDISATPNWDISASKTWNRVSNKSISLYLKVRGKSLQVWGKAQGMWGHWGLCRGWAVRRLHSLLLHKQLLRPALVGDRRGQAVQILQRWSGNQGDSIKLFDTLSSGLYWDNPWLQGSWLWLHWQKSWTLRHRIERNMC